jgi:hypothetical protein
MEKAHRVLYAFTMFMAGMFFKTYLTASPNVIGGVFMASLAALLVTVVLRARGQVS